MKYAVIALVALYLIIYGCSPDNTEKATENHEQTAPSSIETLPAVEKVEIPTEDHAAPVVAEKHQIATATEHTVTDKQPVDVAEHAPAIDTEAPHPQVREAPVTAVAIPCSAKAASTHLSCPHMLQATTKKPADEEQALTVTLQELVETTNEMVLATQKMAVSMQKIVNSTNDIAKGAPETLRAEGSMNKSTVEMLQNVVSAAQEVIDATNKAISKTVKETQQ